MLNVIMKDKSQWCKSDLRLTNKNMEYMLKEIENMGLTLKTIENEKGFIKGYELFKNGEIVEKFNSFRKLDEFMLNVKSIEQIENNNFQLVKLDLDNNYLVLENNHKKISIHDNNIYITINSIYIESLNLLKDKLLILENKEKDVLIIRNKMTKELIQQIINFVVLNDGFIEYDIIDRKNF